MSKDKRLEKQTQKYIKAIYESKAFKDKYSFKNIKTAEKIEIYKSNTEKTIGSSSPDCVALKINRSKSTTPFFIKIITVEPKEELLREIPLVPQTPQHSLSYQYDLLESLICLFLHIGLL